MQTNSAVEKKEPKAKRDAAWKKRALAAIAQGDLKALAALKPEIAANSMLGAEGNAPHAKIALIEAVSNERLEVVKWFLEKSARDNIDVAKIVDSPREKQTALMVAARWGDLEMVQALIHVSNAAAVGSDGYDALWHAASNESFEIAQELFPICNAKTKGKRSGITTLMAMAACEDIGSHKELFRALLAASDPLAQDKDGYTALMHAARWGDPEAIIILLPHSDPKHKNVEKGTAFDCALSRTGETAKWAVVDLLADTAPRKKVDKAFKEAPVGEMPRWAARMEAEALAAVMGASTGPLETTQPRRRKAAGARRV